MMRGLLAVLLIAPWALAPAAEDEAGFESLFDGKSLEVWDGNPDFWRVEEGTITGQTTADKPTKGNTFIIWRKGELADFELKLEYRIVGGNSGIQYRSFEVPNEKWVIGGYQGDFEAGDRYSGICYGERFRGILADRGQKTVIGTDHKPKVVGSVGDSMELQTKIKKEDWNEYHIIAKGFDFTHKINGHVTCELTDEDTEQRRATGLLALQLHAGPPMKVQFRNIRLKTLKKPTAEKTSQSSPAQKTANKKVVFLAGGKSHGYGAHDHLAGCTLLAHSLMQSGLPIQAEVYHYGWPQDSKVLEGADCIVMYGDGGGGHMVNPHLMELDVLAKRGVGIVCLHYAVEVPKGASGDKFLDWIGGYFETNWSVNPHWTAKFTKFPEHPIARGVQPFEINDEWYYHMRFRDGMKGVTPILSGQPGAETLTRPDGPHSGNPDVRRAIAQGEAQHVAWAAERPDGGRGFGFTGGHVHWNWSEPNFRKVVLNAIAWCAKIDIPTSGVHDQPKTLQELEADQDETPPANFNREQVRKQFKLPPDAVRANNPDENKQKQKKGANANKGKRAEKGAAVAVKPAYQSPLVTSRTPNRSVDIDVDITGAQQLTLVVTDGGNGFSCDWADWAEPRLIGPSGEKKLTELKWKSATAEWGQVRINKNANDGDLRIAGKSVEYGIGTHANSVITFDLPAGFARFKARAGLDDGGATQNDGQTTSVEFLVFTNEPSRAFLATLYSNPGAAPVSHQASDAVSQLVVHPDLEATLFASEPMMFSPTDIDIDHLGRVWVCEVVNYRRFRNADQPERKEGDRILIVEDSNQDGIADKTTTFYQGRDIDSAHGICVLGTPTGRGTRAIVSAGDRIFILTDEDGDLKSDRKDVLFSGISGVQHDHGIHAAVLGPDGKLYFNFGNEGKQLRDKNGKPIIDLAGNEVNDQRKPYQQGMVFRCNLDGSQLETLGWNFRNNWEVAVDSFGTLWQSDNDDDGNRGVRINYVMEFGNYGYKDELTGAGWQVERTNLEQEIPLRHWHLNDPGVVPNLLQTGAGSPTGICVYEGSLLPAVFQGQIIHCDAGPSVVRSYPVTNSGAGYKAEIVNILDGSANRWFRPSDVCVAPDGSLIVADWYDPGVGGHRMEDTEHGRLFRVTPPDQGRSYKFSKPDFSTIEGCMAALLSPNLATRSIAWTELHKQGRAAEPALLKVFQETANPRHRARALWLLGKISGRGPHYVELAATDKNSDIRVQAIRLARQVSPSVIPVVQKLVQDPSPQVRRECAIALRHHQDQQAPDLWAQLAAQHDGQDRWYLEALGISADRQWDRYLGAWLKSAGTNWNTATGRDIIWRSRAKQTPELLAKILQDEKTPAETQPRYFRAFDFLTGPEKDAALKSLLGQ